MGSFAMSSREIERAISFCATTGDAGFMEACRVAHFPPRPRRHAPFGGRRVHTIETSSQHRRLAREALVMSALRRFWRRGGRHGRERFWSGRVPRGASPDAACAEQDGAGDRPAGAVRENRVQGDRRRLYRVRRSAQPVHGDSSAAEHVSPLESTNSLLRGRAARKRSDGFFVRERVGGVEETLLRRQKKRKPSLNTPC